jgi:hypothetical protein
MISGKQLKKVLDHSFTAGTGFLAPTASFIANPSTYTITSVPTSVVLNGTIIPNDGVILSWTITDISGTTLAFGSGNSISHTLAVTPTLVSSNIYNLNITYTNTSTGLAQSLIVPATVVVTTAALVGQMNSPTQDITIPADLTPYEPFLASTTQVAVMNLFPVVSANVGRIVFAIPDSYGAVTQIEDGVGLNVIAQFNMVVDSANNRKIYTTINVLTPGTYNYKLIF